MKKEETKETVLIKYLLGEAKTCLNLSDAEVIKRILQDTIEKIEEWIEITDSGAD